jgi:hypothetical protein
MINILLQLNRIDGMFLLKERRKKETREKERKKRNTFFLFGIYLYDKIFYQAGIRSCY